MPSHLILPLLEGEGEGSLQEGLGVKPQGPGQLEDGYQALPTSDLQLDVDSCETWLQPLLPPPDSGTAPPPAGTGPGPTIGGL